MNFKIRETDHLPADCPQWVSSRVKKINNVFQQELDVVIDDAQTCVVIRSENGMFHIYEKPGRKAVNRG